jgi:hypothetical protein
MRIIEINPTINMDTMVRKSSKGEKIPFSTSIKQANEGKTTKIKLKDIWK